MVETILEIIKDWFLAVTEPLSGMDNKKRSQNKVVIWTLRIGLTIFIRLMKSRNLVPLYKISPEATHWAYKPMQHRNSHRVHQRTKHPTEAWSDTVANGKMVMQNKLQMEGKVNRQRSGCQSCLFFFIKRDVQNKCQMFCPALWILLPSEFLFCPVPCSSKHRQDEVLLKSTFSFIELVST